MLRAAFGVEPCSHAFLFQVALCPGGVSLPRKQEIKRAGTPHCGICRAYHKMLGLHAAHDVRHDTGLRNVHHVITTLLYYVRCKQNSCPELHHFALFPKAILVHWVTSLQVQKLLLVQCCNVAMPLGLTGKTRTRDAVISSE